MIKAPIGDKTGGKKMKQSEKYSMLQYAFWYTVVHENHVDVYRLKNNQKYVIGLHRPTGWEIKEIWRKLLEFRDEARNQKKLEEEGGQDEKDFRELIKNLKAENTRLQEQNKKAFEAMARICELTNDEKIIELTDKPWI